MFFGKNVPVEHYGTNSVNNEQNYRIEQKKTVYY